MILFVDLRPAKISGASFACWDTIVERFIEAGGTHAWDTFEELERDLGPGERAGWEIVRLRQLTPEWAFKKPPEEET